MSTDQQIEQEIQAKGLTAQRITPADIEANIKHQYFFTAADGVTLGNQPVASELSLLTFCVLVLRNGFTVTGESACASPENFDAEVVRKIARQNAIGKVWPLMGYELRTQLQAPYPNPGNGLRPTYFVKHPDGSYSEADPQPA